MAPWGSAATIRPSSTTRSAEMIDYAGPVIFDCVVSTRAENCFPMIPSGKAHNEMILPDFQGDTKTVIDAKGKELV